MKCLLVFVVLIHLAYRASNGLAIEPASPQQNYAKLNLVCETQGCVEAASYILEHIDPNVDPCDNFYQFSCGKWLRDASIPDFKASNSAYEILRDKVLERLRKLLENEEIRFGIDSLAINMSRQLYNACLNTTQLEEVGSRPLREIMQSFAKFADAKPGDVLFQQMIVEMKKKYGISMIWGLGTGIDVKNTTGNIFELAYIGMASGLSLGSEKIYLQPERYQDRIDALKQYIASVCDLLIKDSGLPQNETEFLRVDPELFVAFETKLANISTPPENLRNATELYNIWPLAKLKKNIPLMDWDLYIREVLPKEVQDATTDRTIINIAEPKVIDQLNDLLRKTDPKEIMNYAKWDVISGYAGILDERFRHLALTVLILGKLLKKQKTIFPSFYEWNFQLIQSLPFAKVVSGIEQLVPRWKVCVKAATSLKRAISAMYVDQYSTEKDREEIRKIAKNVADVYAEMITNLDWMDQETKEIAMKKLRNIEWKLAYPDYIRNATEVDDYFKRLHFDDADDFFTLSVKYSKWDTEKDYLELLELVDKKRFDFSYIVNAFYMSPPPSIAMPAAWLQPPYFKSDFPLSINYGGVGFTFGHEFTHGFDDEGSQYDHEGNLNEWWTDKTREQFLQRTQCIIDQYSSFYSKEAGLNVNGKLTQGENIADNGGIKEAFLAFKRALTELPHRREFKLPGLPYTPEQLFFLGYSTGECEIRRPESLIQSMLSDPHSPEEFRVIGPLSNFKEFATTFNCKPGTPMNPLKTNKTKCSVW